MDIRFLTTFLEVAQTRHFGRAAENLYLTQSAVSARIKLLEEYFNTTLFIRNRNSIQISPAGEKLIPFAKELSDTLSKAKRSLAQEECQHISCASTQNAFLLCFSNLQPSFLTHFSSVCFQHEIATVEQITRQLHDRSIDFALTTSQVKSDDIDSTLLFEVPLCMYQSNGISEKNNGGVHDINIEWSPAVNDKLAKLHPELRKAKLRTSSIDVAITMACAKPSRFILPISSHGFLDRKLQQVLISFAPSELTQAVKVPVYLNKLKSHTDFAVQEVTTYLQLEAQ